MDLEILCPTAEFVVVEDKKSTPHVDDDDGYNIMDNGSSANYHVEVEVVHSPSSSLAKSPAGAGPTSTTKGCGLKKWRRMKRDFVKDPSPANAVDTSKMLKRGLSSSSANKPLPEIENEINQKTESLVGQVTNGNGFMMQSPCLDVTDSHLNLSSKTKSLTKVRIDLPAVLGYVHQKSQMRLGKKHRGERVKIDKQNYHHSTLESDSNFVFMETLFSLTSIGKQNGEDVPTAYRKENSFEIEPPNLAADEEKSGNCRPSPYQDPLVHSILALQSVQEALENGASYHSDNPFSCFVNVFLLS